MELLQPFSGLQAPAGPTGPPSLAANVVTLGFAGDGSGITTLGFSDLAAPATPGGDATVVLGFAGDGSTITTLGFGAAVVIVPPPTGQLHQAVYARLVGSPAIAALVSSRIYFGALPQSINLRDGPALSYAVISRPYGHVLTGSDGTSQARIQITSHAYQQSTCDLISQAVRDCFQGFAGTMAGVVITATILANEIDLPTPPFAGTDQWTYSIASDYQLNHRVSLPSSLT